MPELTFRHATRADVPDVIALIERAYRGTEAELGWTTETHILEGPRTRTGEVETLVADPDSRFVLAETGDVLAGCALVQRKGTRAYFGMFAVDPRRQTAGIGRALLSECEHFARDTWSAELMTMSVISLRADLIEWYERRGYRRSGTSERFPFHEHSGALRHDFELVHLAKDL